MWIYLFLGLLMQYIMFIGMNWIALDRFYYTVIIPYPPLPLGLGLRKFSAPIMVRCDSVHFVISRLANAVDNVLWGGLNCFRWITLSYNHFLSYLIYMGSGLGKFSAPIRYDGMNLVIFGLNCFRYMLLSCSCTKSSLIMD